MDTKKLADISGLTFTQKEYEQFAKDFQQAIEYVAPVLDVKLSSVPIHPPSVDISELREDIVVPSLTIDQALKNALKKRGRYIVVPQVVE